MRFHLPPLRGPLRTALVALLLLVSPGPAGLATPAQDSAVSLPDTSITSSVSLPAPGQHEVLPPVARPFRPGESLRFSVQYGFIHAGTAWLEVPEEREWHGHDIFRLRARAESNTFFSTFYKVRNVIESYWDRDGRFSLRYHEDRREGSYRFKGTVDFDPDHHEARYDSGQEFPIPPRVQDALSSFYYTRYQALPIGGSLVFDYHASRRSAPLQIRVLGRERITVPAGTFDCVAIEPTLKAGGIFKNSGRLVIWITEDDRRMPVLMKSKLTIGSISVVLQDARPGT